MGGRFYAEGDNGVAIGGNLTKESTWILSLSESF
jgi:hypothetical protein